MESVRTMGAMTQKVEAARNSLAAKESARSIETFLCSASATGFKVYNYLLA
jgi:hypothetical protein